jgi:ABC-2 type transport system permease protein
MNTPTTRFERIQWLAKKDWHIFQKQLAAYMLGLIVALILIGTAKTVPFYIGSLLLMCLLLCVGGFSIQSSVMNDRKEKTLPFVMSLPIDAGDLFWAKILSTMTIYAVPFFMVVIVWMFLVFYTPIPDGFLVWSLLFLCFLALLFVLSLSAAVVIESEGWITFVMISLSVLVSPYMMGLAQIDDIQRYTKGEVIVWNSAALTIMGAQIAIGALALWVAYRVHTRKTTFL